MLNIFCISFNFVSKTDFVALQGIQNAIRFFANTSWEISHISVRGYMSHIYFVLQTQNHIFQQDQPIHDNMGFLRLTGELESHSITQSSNGNGQSIWRLSFHSSSTFVHNSVTTP